MRFAVKDMLTEEEIQKGLRGVIKDGLATQTMITLTGGVWSNCMLERWMGKPIGLSKRA